MNTFRHFWSGATREEQEQFVDRLRAMSYAEFLESSYWEMIRNHVIALRGYQCERCLKRHGKIDLHHLHYQNHGFEADFLEDLQLLCSTCHLLAHELQTLLADATGIPVDAIRVIGTLHNLRRLAEQKA